jgi:hypothetical protein
VFDFRVRHDGGDKVEKRGLILVRSIVIIAIAIAVATSGSMLAQEVVTMRLERHNGFSLLMG